MKQYVLVIIHTIKFEKKSVSLLINTYLFNTFSTMSNTSIKY